MLLDDLLAHQLWRIPSARWSKVLRATFQFLPHSVVYRIDNLSEYYNGRYLRSRGWGALKEVAPTVAPLGKSTFFEWTDHSFPQPTRVGVHMLAQDMQGVAAEIRWQYTIVCWMEDPRMSPPPILPTPLIGILPVRPDGTPRDGGLNLIPGDDEADRYLTPSSMQWAALDTLMKKRMEDNPEIGQAAQDVAHLIANACLAIALAHCKNVRIVEQDQQYASRQQRRAAERAGKPPRVRYRVLEIDPDHVVVQHEQQGSSQSTAWSLHLVRGHFATYTEEKPLFGKYAGRFFVPQHKRGTIKAGAVVKDYAVLDPSDPGNTGDDTR